MARQQDPQQDAAKVVAVREAVGHSIVLRADANRKWSLNQAVAFGHAVRGADLQVSSEPFHVLLALAAHWGGDRCYATSVLRCCMKMWLCYLDTHTYSCQNGCAVDQNSDTWCWHVLQYLEEPVQDVRDLPAYFSQTGIPIGLDETLDEAFAGQPHESGLTVEDRLARLVCELGKGAVGSLVVKPGAVGGFERGLDLHRWAIKHGIHVSGAFSYMSCSCTARRHAVLCCTW